MAGNDAFTQQALAADDRFRLRLANALSKVAWEVLEEDAATDHHTERAAFAHRVLGSGAVPPMSGPSAMAAQLAPSFVNRPNVFAFETSYSFTVGGVVTLAGDADIESQLRSDWNELSGVPA